MVACRSVSLACNCLTHTDTFFNLPHLIHIYYPNSSLPTFTLPLSLPDSHSPLCSPNFSSPIAFIPLHLLNKDHGTLSHHFMASCPITSWQIDGEIVETVVEFIFLGSKITADGDYSHEIKMLTPWKKSYDQPR